MKGSNSIIKERFSYQPQLLRSNLENVLIASPRQIPQRLSTPRTDKNKLSRSRINQQMNIQNINTSPFSNDNTRQLSFGNLKKSLKNPLNINTCINHNSKPAQYKQLNSNQFLCKQCALQVASKGIKVQQTLTSLSNDNFDKMLKDCCLKITESNQILNLQFNRIKTAVSKQISCINEYYTTIIEEISEMQIKDILLYETCLKNAQKEYNNAINQIQLSNREFLNYSNVSNTLPIEEIFLNCKAITKRLQNITINTKFQLIKQDSDLRFKIENITNNTSILRLNIGSNKLKHIFASQIMKSNSTLQSQKQRKVTKICESVQDTPQSLKSKISVSAKSGIIAFEQLKTIQFCESITDLPQMLLTANENMQSLNNMFHAPKSRYSNESIQQDE